MSDNDTIATTAPPVAAAKKHLSKGDKLFDTLVYTGLNNISTFVLSLGITYGLLHGFKKVGVGNKAVNEHFKKAEGVFGKFLNKINPGLGGNTKGLEGTAGRALLTTALGVGGTLMIAPIKFLEDRRTGIVDYFNKKLGDKTDPSELKEAPKQSWGSLLFGRAAAWTTVFVSLTGANKLLGKDQKTGLARFTQFENWFAEHVVAKPLGKSVKTFGEHTAQFRLGKIAAIDVFATIAATLILETSSKLFARRREEKESLQAPSPESTVAMPRVTPLEQEANAPNASPRTQISEASLATGSLKDMSPELAAQPQLG